jgi:uncharacterized protein (TIGR02118 family)
LVTVENSGLSKKEMRVQKFVGLIRRRADFSPEAFREYYETRHVPLAKRLIADYIADYRRKYPEIVTAPGSPDAAVAPADAYDCVTEIWFEEGQFERMQAMLSAHPDRAKQIEEDEAKFMDRSQVRLMICNEVRGFA